MAVAGVTGDGIGAALVVPAALAANAGGEQFGT
jgi:hypothetical protein